MDAPRIILIALGVYATIGAMFAIWFALVGAARLDPAARAGSSGFRAMILPGACALWPILLRRSLRARSAPLATETHP